MINKIINNYDFDDFFEKWFHEYKDSDNFEDYVWHNQEKDIEEFKLENPNISQSELDKWEDNQLRINAREWFDDYLDNWEKEFNQKIQFEDEYVFVYRCITVPNIKEFINSIKNGYYIKNYQGLGIFWSWDKDKADSHWGHHSDGEKDIVLKAKVHYSLIDFETSMILNFAPSIGFDEAEFQLMEGNEIFLLSVIDESNDQEFEINKNLLI